ncbi:MAG: hypothetical protein V1733_09495 [bacterium]
MNRKIENANSEEIRHLIEALRRHEPQLDNPLKLQEAILTGIASQVQEKPSPYTGKIISFPRLIFLQRFLTAASVCLMLILGVEQFVFVEKVNKLEKQNSEAKLFPSGRISARMARNGIPLQYLEKKFLGRSRFLSASARHRPDSMYEPFKNQ